MYCIVIYRHCRIVGLFSRIFCCASVIAEWSRSSSLAIILMRYNYAHATDRLLLLGLQLYLVSIHRQIVWLTDIYWGWCTGHMHGPVSQRRNFQAVYFWSTKTKTEMQTKDENETEINASGWKYRTQSLARNGGVRLARVKLKGMSTSSRPN